MPKTLIAGFLPAHITKMLLQQRAEIESLPTDQRNSYPNRFLLAFVVRYIDGREEIHFPPEMM